MRRAIRGAGAVAVSCGFLVGLSSTAVAATSASAGANAPLRYLYGQVGADGSVAGSMGATEDAVIDDAVNGYDPATLVSPTSGVSAYHYLGAHRATITTAGAAAKYVIAWASAGRPAAIDATTVLATLNRSTAAGGLLGANGAFHSADPAVETANAYSQSLAVLADLATGHHLPAHAVGWLTCAQRVDGGFGYAIDDRSSTPPASCGDVASDTNDTAIVLQALGRAGVPAADARAESYLRSAQQADGGLGFNPSGPSDPDSDAVVIQALVAIGQDPTGSSWTTARGANPVSDMESFADPHGSGGYIFPGNTSPDAFTTTPIPQALALAPYGTARTIQRGSSPPPLASPTAAPPSPVPVPVPSTGASDPAWPGPMAAVLLLIAGTAALAAAGARRREPPLP